MLVLQGSVCGAVSCPARRQDSTGAVWPPLLLLGTSTVPQPQLILQNYSSGFISQEGSCFVPLRADAGYQEAVSYIDILSHAVFCTWIFSLGIDRCTENTYYSCL